MLMSSRLFRLCALAILVELFLLVSIAQSQTPFTIQETGVQHIFTDDSEPGTLYLHVENNTSNRITLRADLDGSSNFSLPHDHFVFSIPPDSSAFTIPIYFKPIPGDTSQTFLTVICYSPYSSQKVEIWGFDLRTPSPEYIWTLGEKERHFGTYYSGGDNEIFGHVRNNSEDTITVTASILDGSYGIAVSGAAAIRIAPDGVANHLFVFDAQNHDSAYAQVQFSGEGKLDTLKLFARAIGDTLYWYYRTNFYDVPTGDTVCKTVTIHNRMSPNTGYVTALDILTRHAGDFFLSGAPSLPFAIAPGDSLELTICYVGPHDHEWSETRLYVTYDFPDQIERSHVVLLYGSIDCDINLRTSVLEFDSIVIGVPRQKSIWLHNPHGMHTTIDSISFGGDSRFSTGARFPAFIGPQDSIRLDLAFIATPQQLSAGDLTIYTQCGVLAMDLVIPEIKVDSSWIALYNDQERTLTFSGDTGRRSVTYRFYNDQPDSVTILSVSLAQGSLFEITAIEPTLPIFKLAPYGLMDVTVMFTGSPGSYSDTLVIVTETSVVALHFPIAAVISGSSVGRLLPSEVAISLSPNPSTGIVRVQVHGGKARSIEVLDLLGATINTLTTQEDSWDGSQVPAGVYFLRVSGLRDDGQPFVSMQRVVIE